MKRGEMLSDMPPISVVTAVGGPSRQSKMNAPMILTKPLKKDSSDTLQPTIASRPPNCDNAPVGSTATVWDAAPNQAKSTSDNTDDKQVDSALLSALRDKRERMALLRLEQTLIDFMNDKTCGYMEVGGANNSTVIRGASGGSPDAEAADNGVGRSQAMNGYNGNDNAGRQTSFQRLCLHRLADRFSIVREQGYNHQSNYMNNSPGLIRLVKVKESRIPTVKLINLDLTQYDQSVPQDRGEDFGVVGMTDRLAGTNLQDAAAAVAVKKPKKKEKMKIMKRSSSNSIANGNEKNGKANARKGKKLSDKEKAYAEARARIFNSDEASPTNLEGSDHALPSNESAAAESLSNSANQSAAPSPVLGQSGSPSPPQERETVLQLPSFGGVNAAGSYDFSKPKRGCLPAAATGGAASKVTWRNREQEASDPDFRRGHHPVMVQAVPVHVAGGNSAGLNANAQYYSPNAMTGNGQMPHGGYHYGGMVDGQMYNPAGYASAPAPIYHADVSWHTQEPSPAAYEPQQQNPENRASAPASKEAPRGYNAQKIDLSQEEFPALR
jgi:hypothetical protein